MLALPFEMALRLPPCSQGAEELAGAGVQGAEPPVRGSGGTPPRFRKPGREPSPKAACDVAEASRGFFSSLLGRPAALAAAAQAV